MWNAPLYIAASEAKNNVRKEEKGCKEREIFSEI